MAPSVVLAFAILVLTAFFNPVDSFSWPHAPRTGPNCHTNVEKCHQHSLTAKEKFQELAAVAAITTALCLGSLSSPALALNEIQPMNTPVLVADALEALEEDTEFMPPLITTHSDQRAKNLAARLSGLDSKMYGAYWCSHCYAQKQKLGQEAMEDLPYIECAKKGFNSEFKLCNAKKIPGYPTWEINGQFYPGEQSIQELEDIAELEEVVLKDAAKKK